jgi:hypothetical protein
VNKPAILNCASAFSLSPIGGEGWGEGAAHNFLELWFVVRAAERRCSLLKSAIFYSSNTGQMVLPLLGERAGVGADVPLTFLSLRFGARVGQYRNLPIITGKWHQLFFIRHARLAISCV